MVLIYQGLFPSISTFETPPEKGVTLNKQAMHAVEARLVRHPELPKWDILIHPALT
jgi:hypothetical protein